MWTTCAHPPPLWGWCGVPMDGVVPHGAPLWAHVVGTPYPTTPPWGPGDGVQVVSQVLPTPQYGVISDLHPEMVV